MRQKGANDVPGENPTERKFAHEAGRKLRLGSGGGFEIMVLGAEALQRRVGGKGSLGDVIKAEGCILVHPGSEDTTIQRRHRAGDADPEIWLASEALQCLYPMR